jgi:hypothetical protein
MRVVVNRKEIERRHLRFPIDLGSRKWSIGVVVADENKKNSGAFQLSEIVIFAQTLSAKDIQIVQDNVIKFFSLE